MYHTNKEPHYHFILRIKATIVITAHGHTHHYIRHRSRWSLSASGVCCAIQKGMHDILPHLHSAELILYLLISFIFKYISICLEYTHLGGELQKFMTFWMKKCILMSVLNNLSLFWRHWLRSDHSIKGKYPFNEYLAKPSAAFNDIMSFFLDNVGLICLFPPCVANISHCRNQTVALPLSCPSFFTSSY